MEVDINNLLDLVEKLNVINRADLREITFIRDGKKVEISPEIVDEFRFCGLNNVDFITSEFYLKGFENEK